MSEMLGNQYFLARNYAAAAKQLKKALRHDAKNKSMRRKMIICLNEIGEIRNAFRYFISLVKEDADFIIKTDPIGDDCPCPELVFDAERELNNNLSSVDFVLRLAMLWLYCDIHESFRYFLSAQQMSPADSDIKTILTVLKPKVLASQKTSNSAEAST